MAFVYFITGVVSTEFFTEHRLVTVVAFAPEGFALAAVLIYGLRILPGIFIGQIMLAVYQWTDILGAASIGLGNTLEAYVAYKILSHVSFNPRLERINDILWLIGGILFIFQPISALWGNTTLYLFGILNSSNFFSSLFDWWLGNVMGQILFTPFLLTLYYRKKEIRFPILIAVFLAFFTYDYILQINFDIDNPSLLLLFTLPLTLFTAVKHIVYGLASSIALTVHSLFLIHFGEGTFAQHGDTIHNIVNLNIYILTHILIVLIVATLFDEKHRLVTQLQAIAHYDYLTGLPNRYLLRTEIEHAVSSCKSNGTKSAVCYIDLDDFKPINDKYGHHFGDILLKEITSRIKHRLSTQDALLRIGGDEFLIIFKHIANIDEVRNRLETIMNECTEPFHFEGVPLQVSLSVGVSICPDQGTTVKELMEKADNAMYQAKTNGKNQIAFA
jgi:diguanylate cyclase (GGDEF)-like protein